MASEIFPIQLYATGASSTDADAVVDIPVDGNIVAVEWTVRATAGYGSDDFVTGQLSFIATHQLLQNDVRGAISNVIIAAGVLTTSGIPDAQANKYVLLPDPGIAVSSGERVYVHTLTSAVTAYHIQCIVWLGSRRAPPRRSARRR